MGFTGNDRGIRVAILILLLAFVGMTAGWCSKAKAEEQGLSLGFGVATAGSDPCFESMLLAQSFADDRWVAYLSTHGEADNCCGEPMRANVGAGIIRTAHAGKWTLGFGAGVLEHQDMIIGGLAIESLPAPRVGEQMQFVAAILLRRRIGKRLSLDLLHNSTGGASANNRGLNTMTISWLVP